MNNPHMQGSYTHFPSPVRSYLFSIALIVLSAIPGAMFAWFLLTRFGVSGVGLGVGTALLGMAFSLALFAGWVALGKVTGVIKPVTAASAASKN